MKSTVGSTDLGFSKLRKKFSFVARPLGLASIASLLFACGLPLSDEGGNEEGIASDDGNRASVEQGVGVTINIRFPVTFTADVTGDGFDDYIEVTESNAFKVNGNIWLQHGGESLQSAQIALVDLNGDKKKDVVVQGYDNRFWASLSTGTSFTTPGNWVTHGGGYAAGQAQYGDVNGDGKADLVFQGTDNKFWVSLSTGTSFTPPSNWVTHGGGYLRGQAQYADVNGDRKTDLIFQGTDNRFWVSLSKGTSFTPPMLWATHGGSYGYHTAQYGDVNGDGKADLVFRSPENYWVALSTGRAFQAHENWYQGKTHWYFTVRDRNGDGRADLVISSQEAYGRSTGHQFAPLAPCYPGASQCP